MKVKMLKSKATAMLVGRGLTNVTIRPAGWLVDTVHTKWIEEKVALQVRYIREHRNELSAQEKYDAVRMFGSDLAWLDDPVMDATFALEHQQMKHGDFECRRFLDKYDYLVDMGVQPCERHVAWYSEAHRIIMSGIINPSS